MREESKTEAKKMASIQDLNRITLDIQETEKLWSSGHQRRVWRELQLGRLEGLKCYTLSELKIWMFTWVSLRMLVGYVALSIQNYNNRWKERKSGCVEEEMAQGPM